MKEALDLEKIAELLNFGVVATDIYVTLLAHGELPEEDLATLLDKTSEEVTRALDELLGKGMVFELNGEGDVVVYQVLTPLQLEESLDRQKEIIKNLKKSVIPQFQSSPKLSIVKYEGLEGIRKVYLEVLEEAIRTGEDILAFESEEQGPLLGTEFLENYIKRRIDAKIMAYVIGPVTEVDKAYKERVEGKYTHVKLLPDFKLGAEINMVGDLVMTFSVDPAEGTLRRNSAEAATLKEIFRKMWG